MEKEGGFLHLFLPFRPLPRSYGLQSNRENENRKQTNVYQCLKLKGGYERGTEKENGLPCLSFNSLPLPVPTTNDLNRKKKSKLMFASSKGKERVRRRGRDGDAEYQGFSHLLSRSFSSYSGKMNV